MKQLFLTIVFVVVMLGTSHGQSYKVIVNTGNELSAVNKKELSNYFMKKASKYPTGTRVLPVDQKGNSVVRKSFTTDVHGKSVTAIKSFWQQSVFQGKSTPPVEKSSDAAIIEYVKSNPGAIGYVSSGTDTSGVKTITVTN